MHLRPDNLGTTRAILTFVCDVRGLEDLERADQIAILRRTFADVGDVATRILAELDDAPMYFDAAGTSAPRTGVRAASHCSATPRFATQPSAASAPAWP